MTLSLVSCKSKACFRFKSSAATGTERIGMFLKTMYKGSAEKLCSCSYCRQQRKDNGNCIDVETASAKKCLPERSVLGGAPHSAADMLMSGSTLQSTPPYTKPRSSLGNCSRREAPLLKMSRRAAWRQPLKGPRIPEAARPTDTPASSSRRPTPAAATPVTQQPIGLAVCGGLAVSPAQ